MAAGQRDRGGPIPNLIESLARLMDRNEGKGPQRYSDNAPRADKGRSLKNWIKLFTKRQGAIDDVIQRAGGQGNISAAEFLGRAPTSGTGEKGLLRYAQTLLNTGKKLADDPAYGDRVVAAEKDAAGRRKQGQAYTQFQRTFFNPRASR